MTSKCEHLNHLLKTASQSKFSFSLTSFAPQFPDLKLLKMCLRFAVLSCSEKLHNIFKIGLKVVEGENIF